MRGSECGEAGLKFPQIIRQGFGNPFWDYRDPCGPGSLMARYQTQLLFDNRQILLFMNGAEPSSRLHRRFFAFSLCTPLYRSYVPVTSTTRVKRILLRDLSTYDIDNVDRGSCVFEKLIFCFVKTISLANGNVLLNYDPWSITDPNRHPS